MPASVLGPFVGQARNVSIDATSLSTSDTLPYPIFIREGVPLGHRVCWPILWIASQVLYLNYGTSSSRSGCVRREGFANKVIIRPDLYAKTLEGEPIRTKTVAR